MDYWGPKHIELLKVMNKINHKILCILLYYIYIARWYTVPTIPCKIMLGRSRKLTRNDRWHQPGAWITVSFICQICIYREIRKDLLFNCPLFISTPLQVLMAWCLITHIYNFLRCIALPLTDWQDGVRKKASGAKMSVAVNTEIIWLVANNRCLLVSRCSHNIWYVPYSPSWGLALCTLWDPLRRGTESHERLNAFRLDPVA
jgi:hypothetical protein